MAIPQTGTGQSGGTRPVACSLAPAGLAAQAGCWQRLIAWAMTERTETADAYLPHPVLGHT